MPFALRSGGHDGRLDDHAPRGGDIVRHGLERILHCRNGEAVFFQEGDDFLPAGAIGKGAVDQDDGRRRLGEMGFGRKVSCSFLAAAGGFPHLTRKKIFLATFLARLLPAKAHDIISIKKGAIC